MAAEKASAGLATLEAVSGFDAEGAGESRESRESRESGQRIARIKKEIKRQTLVIHDDFLVIHGPASIRPSSTDGSSLLDVSSSDGVAVDVVPSETSRKLDEAAGLHGLPRALRVPTKRPESCASVCHAACAKPAFSSTVYPTGNEAMLHAVESVPHGRTRRRARAASVCERVGHQVVVEGFAEARQGT